MVKNGSSHGQKQALCRACGTNVSIRYSTAYLDLHAAPAIFETAARKLITAVEGHHRQALRAEVQAGRRDGKKGDEPRSARWSLARCSTGPEAASGRAAWERSA